VRENLKRRRVTLVLFLHENTLSGLSVGTGSCANFWSFCGCSVVPCEPWRPSLLLSEWRGRGNIFSANSAMSFNTFWRVYCTARHVATSSTMIDCEAIGLWNCWYHCYASFGRNGAFTQTQGTHVYTFVIRDRCNFFWEQGHAIIQGATCRLLASKMRAQPSR
jgi:hypothetical protein